MPLSVQQAATSHICPLTNRIFKRKSHQRQAKGKTQFFDTKGGLFQKFFVMLHSLVDSALF